MDLVVDQVLGAHLHDLLVDWGDWVGILLKRLGNLQLPIHEALLQEMELGVVFLQHGLLGLVVLSELLEFHVGVENDLPLVRELVEGGSQ